MAVRECRNPAADSFVFKVFICVMFTLISRIFYVVSWLLHKADTETTKSHERTQKKTLERPDRMIRTLDYHLNLRSLKTTTAAKSFSKRKTVKAWRF